MIKFPLNDIRDENIFFDYKSNLINMWKDKQIGIYNYSPEQMFNYTWCNLDTHVYIKGEKYKDGMKYYIQGEINENGDYIGGAIYIHKDFYGVGKYIVAQSLIEGANLLNCYDSRIYCYTSRGSKVISKLFKEFDAQPEIGYNVEGMEGYSMAIGSKYKEKYLATAAKIEKTAGKSQPFMGG